MATFHGTTVCKGIAVGPAFILHEDVYEELSDPSGRVSEEELKVEAELTRLARALDLTKKRMDRRVLDAGIRVGREAAQIFLVHKLILEGEEFKKLAKMCIIEGRMNAEEAILQSGGALAERFAEMDDEYMKARADDINDITREMVDILKETGDPDEIIGPNYPYVLIARRLRPSTVMSLEKHNVLAIVTTEGSPTSHASILAHMMDIPMVTGVDLDIDGIEPDTSVYVNADAGEVIVRPEIDYTEEVKRHSNNSFVSLKHLIGEKTETRSGRQVDLYANISSVADMSVALTNDAEGIGLYRSEFLYMDRSSAPDEEEQFAIYKELLKMAMNRTVTVRTLDPGPDKLIPYIKGYGDADEASRNPRGIAMSLVQKDMFRTQLRALVRASVHGNLRIMYPMVNSVADCVEANSTLAEVKWELLPVVGSTNFKQGIMVETVEAVKIADELAQHAEFFSIGTNDLTGSIYGLDREKSYDDMIKDDYEELFVQIGRVVRSAHKAGISVSICGEIAGNRRYTKRLLDCGVDCLSVVPADILVMRDHIRNNC